MKRKLAILATLYIAYYHLDIERRKRRGKKKKRMALLEEKKD